MSTELLKSKRLAVTQTALTDGLGLQLTGLQFGRGASPFTFAHLNRGEAQELAATLVLWLARTSASKEADGPCVARIDAHVELESDAIRALVARMLEPEARAEGLTISEKPFTVQPGLTVYESEIVALLFESSKGNGHDFGCIEDIKDQCDMRRARGVISSLVKKNWITVHDPVTNGSGTWTQFTFDDAARQHLGIEAN